MWYNSRNPNRKSLFKDISKLLDTTFLAQATVQNVVIFKDSSEILL